ncbi:Na-translocating system protein MpsC family protein [Litchfieldia alkalitelluris]|uniref:Na-translocating system protein MpsC family protein n=1 Tax=Litchfieldia alkalitelluris TaxID=304268 RepID=UPI00147459AA|nr:Na-translocating system protein MpsC family protein [Litchfieldia alkalitelluris]
MKNVYSPYQEDLLQLSSTFSKMLKQKFGKGPETCFITFHSNRLAIHVKNYMTPAEEALIEDNKELLAYNFRYAVMETVLGDFKVEAYNRLGITFDTYYNDWNYEHNSGILLLEPKNSMNWIETKADHLLKERLIDQISKISSFIHKVPEKVELIKINHNMFAVQCKGAITKIESVLYRKGQVDLLQEHARDVKNNYLNHREDFQSVFGRPIEGFYMTWDYPNNHCYLFFHLK